MMIRKIIENITTAVIAMIGLIGGIIWASKTKWDYEPMILVSISSVELLAFIILRSISSNSEKAQMPLIQEASKNERNTNEQKVNVNVSIGQQNEQPQIETKTLPLQSSIKRDEIIEIMKSRVHILFIDDDKKFNVVRNLKDGGWKQTKTIEDIKNVDVPLVKRSYILFVDINGVGKILNLEYEGLDLALMLKQKYPDKKVIIYSANKNSNSFHEAWKVCDYRLEKNALPYQFQSLVESYSIELYQKPL